MKLSILIPTYNEEQWLEAIVERVLKQPVEGITQRELIIVDDGSKDSTRSIIEKLAKKYSDIIFYEFHAVNQGKGAAIRTAIEKMTGDMCIIQDADWEYDPADYPLVLEPIIQ
ncbi:MAG: glycosyltransferase family 2 protein, partial [Candidatus Omnitrophica bacterium]|nr:glycosyltransferase family 2 protein [Candidatus Omnitrophota bacterium]